MREREARAPSTPSAPSADVPPLSVRWEGLVVIVDANTLNTVVRRATARIPEIQQVLIEPEDGQLSLSVRVRKGVRVPLKSRIGSIRWKDGWLGFHVDTFTVFGFVPIPDWVIRRIVELQPPGFAFFYPDQRVVVLNLSTLLPPELSLNVRDVVCENGELRLLFGPSQYRLDKLLETLDRDPFDWE